MNRTILAAALAALLSGTLDARQAAPEVEVDVELTNTSDKDFKDLPVFLQIFRLFGRGVDYSKFNPKWFRVLDAAGKELEFSIRPVPPDFSLANDEIVLVLPAFARNETLKLRFVN